LRDDQQAQPPNAADFRQLMGLFTTGVCVVSVETPEQKLAAMTVNSLVSVSLDPMLVCWSLQNSASQFDLFGKADRFAISILGSTQTDIAQRYAARGDTMLHEGDFAERAHGIKVVAGAIGYLECRAWSSYEAGDHTMIFGEVAATDFAEQQPTVVSTLAFFGGQFCSIKG